MVQGGTPRPLDFSSVHAASGVESPINHYFVCQIRNLRGRFTPGGFLLEEFFEKFDFFELFEIIDSFLV